MKKSACASKAAAMDSPSAIFPSFFLLLLFVILSTSTVSSSPFRTNSYSENCAHMVPEAALATTTTTTLYTVYPFLEPETSHYSGGERILGWNNSNPGYIYHSRKSLYFVTTRNIFNTNIDGLYKIEAHLVFTTPHVFRVFSNSTPNWLSRNMTHRRRSSSLDFLLNGFWSVSSKKLCMVGSASWYSNEGKLLNLEAVLKLNFARKLTVHTSLISGVLESLATSSNDPSYFESITIVGFPRVTPHNYNYSLVSEEGCSGGNIPPNSSLSLKGSSICAMFSRRHATYKLQYPSECSSSKNCTPFGGPAENFTSLMSLFAIQCSETESDQAKLRYLVGFPKSRYFRYKSTFDPSTALVGEGIWDGKNNQLCIVVCRILNQDDPLGNAHPGDCSIHLNLRYQAVWSIKNSVSVQGEIWSNKTAKDVGYFERIKFQSTDDREATLPGLKYEYTEMERVTKSCPLEKPIQKKGQRYPDGHSYSMRFDFSVKHLKQFLAWGYAVPISVGSQLYDQDTRIVEGSRHGYAVAEELGHEADVLYDMSVPIVSAATRSGPMNISFKIDFRPTIGIKWGTGFSSLNASLGNEGVVKISAEGVYDDRTGHLCMVGCRRLISNEQETFDCEILVKMQFPAESGTDTTGLIMGSIESTRNKEDSLYFERLDITSSAITNDAAIRTIWRMDLEIIMVLISNTLACVFVGLQLLHVKKQFHVLPSISLFMLLILTLSHMIPLVLNFEALFMGHHGRQNVMLGSGGWLEVNEVLVRIVTMVVFVLEFRLFQLAWTAKFSSNGNEKGAWTAEIKTLFVCLPLYIIGGSVALLVNWKSNKHYSMKQLSYVAMTQKHSLWGDLRSYVGLVLDGFLIPQILLNIFQSSKGSCLSPWFYAGTAFVRSLPHAYDLYRGHRYTRHRFDRLYIFGNPRADFYSPFWDVAIPCGGIVSVAIVAFQQHFGGRFFLPRRLRESGEYEMVPVVSS